MNQVLRRENEILMKNLFKYKVDLHGLFVEVENKMINDLGRLNHVSMINFSTLENEIEIEIKITYAMQGLILFEFLSQKKISLKWYSEELKKIENYLRKLIGDKLKHSNIKTLVAQLNYSLDKYYSVSDRLDQISFLKRYLKGPGIYKIIDFYKKFSEKLNYLIEQLRKSMNDSEKQNDYNSLSTKKLLSEHETSMIENSRPSRSRIIKNNPIDLQKKNIVNLDSPKYLSRPSMSLVSPNNKEVATESILSRLQNVETYDVDKIKLQVINEIIQKKRSIFLFENHNHLTPPETPLMFKRNIITSITPDPLTLTTPRSPNTPRTPSTPLTPRSRLRGTSHFEEWSDEDFKLRNLNYDKKVN